MSCRGFWRAVAVATAAVCIGQAPIARAEAVDSDPSSGAAFPFSEGDVASNEAAGELRDWLPAPFWESRRFFFHPGMRLQIGPVQRDYSPPAVYRDATLAHRGESQLGPDGSLLDYRSGQPFPVEDIDCTGDPDAGTKLIWNFVHRWQGFGAAANFRYAYIDRGEVLPLYYQGTTFAWLLKHRPEPQFASTGGDVFKGENRLMVVGFEVDAPLQARGTRTLTYRYADSYGPLDGAPPEDTWFYSRSVRRVRKISQTQRSNAVAGTDFSFDDLFTFSGLPPQYDWRCVSRARLLAPMNTTVLGFPFEPAGDASAPNYGPSGLSYANDRWELRDAIEIEMVPKDPDHPYSRKRLWIDEQTMQPLYSFAYDKTGSLWKVIHHNHRWSEDPLGDQEPDEWYPGWESVPRPRDLRIVSDSIANVQTGTGNRLDFWDSQGTLPDLKDVKRYIDLQRLRRGR